MVSRRRRLQYAWILFFAFLPSISFAGHWDLQLSILGTPLSLGFTQAHAHVDASDRAALAAHRDHCHGDASECSDQPLVGSAPVAHLGEMVATAASLNEVPGVCLACETRPESAAVAPDLPPPRAL